MFLEHEIRREGGDPEVALPPDAFNRLAQSVAEQARKAASNRLYPAVVTFANRRRFVRAVLHAKGVKTPVVSYEEIDPAARPKLLGAA
jgi:flagellar biosynthesis protein FlhA